MFQKHQKLPQCLQAESQIKEQNLTRCKLFLFRTKCFKSTRNSNNTEIFLLKKCDHTDLKLS